MSLIDQGKDIYEMDLDHPPTIHFDRHLYQPLLVKNGDDVKSTPPALEPSEKDFVSTLRSYLESSKDPHEGKEVFLLRNLSRGKGIGFFNTVGFYPDFILWIKAGERQRVVFVEPHGLYHDNAPDRNDKVNLHKDLKALSQSIAEKRGTEDIKLDSYIITATPPETLKDQWGEGWEPERFTEEHILFQNDLKNKMPLLLEGP